MTDTAAHFLQVCHFLRPLWLLALPPLWGAVLWLARRRTRTQDWTNVIDADLLPALQLEDTAGPANGLRPWPWLALAWTLAVLALAGPSWQQDRAAAYRAPAAWVLVMDLSPSMAASDLSPDRATRARYALDDVLGAARDARVGMVVFSDEAYTVAPLTQDVATIRALMPALAPDMMPTPGDHLAPALDLARQLLTASGSRDPHIVLVSDGFDDPAAALRAAAALHASGVSLDVIGVGTPGGAPLRGADGQFVRNASGQPALAGFGVDALQQLATVGGGRYVGLADLPSLVAHLQAATSVPSEATAAPGVNVAHWSDAGAYLLPTLLLLAALLTRRRWL
jgi:Ca-activated chloride channel family protein